MADRSLRFSRYLQAWWTRQHDGVDENGSWTKGRDALAVAAEFRRDAQFEISQARFLLRRPSADVASGIVATLVPAPSDEDAELLVNAIVRAGATAQRVRATTAVGASVTVVALVVRGVLRGR